MIQLAKVKVELAQSQLEEHETALQQAKQLPTKAQYNNFVANYKSQNKKFYDGVGQTVF